MTQGGLNVPNKETGYDDTFFESHRQHSKSYFALADVLYDIILQVAPGGRNEDVDIQTKVTTLDVGCGHGLLVEALRRKGIVNSHCLEGGDKGKEVSMWPKEYTANFYKIQDLEDENAMDAVVPTDVVTTFEVGEHIRPEKASHFVELLTVHSPKLVVFGAATVFQDRGLNPTHLNENTFDYWIEKFYKQGYVVDWLKTAHTRFMLLQQPAMGATWWYPKNILLFRPERQAVELANHWRSNPEPIDLRGEQFKNLFGLGEFGQMWIKDWSDFTRLFYAAKQELHPAVPVPVVTVSEVKGQHLDEL